MKEDAFGSVVVTIYHITVGFLQLLSPVRLFCDPMGWLSMRLCREEYWSGLLCPSSEDPPNPGIKPGPPSTIPALWAIPVLFLTRKGPRPLLRATTVPSACGRTSGCPTWPSPCRAQAPLTAQGCPQPPITPPSTRIWLLSRGRQEVSEPLDPLLGQAQPRDPTNLTRNTQPIATRGLGRAGPWPKATRLSSTAGTRSPPLRQATPCPVRSHPDCGSPDPSGDPHSP